MWNDCARLSRRFGKDLEATATMGHSTPVSTLRLFFGFLWRGTLLGLVGGVVTALVFVWCLFLTMSLVQDTVDPLLSPIRYSVPALTGIGYVIGYVVGTFDARRQRQRYAAVCALMGCVLAAYPILFIVLLASPISTIVGGAIGLILSIPISLVLASITRARHAPPVDKDAYVARMRVIALLISFIGASPALILFARLADGAHYSGDSPWMAYTIITLIVGAFAAMVAWFFVPYLVNWYIDETLPWRDFGSRQGSASADDPIRLS